MELKFQLTQDSYYEVKRLNGDLKQRFDVAKERFRSLQEALDDLEPYYEEAEEAINGFQTEDFTNADSPYFDADVNRLCDYMKKNATIQHSYHVGMSDFE